MNLTATLNLSLNDINSNDSEFIPEHDDASEISDHESEEPNDCSSDTMDDQGNPSVCIATLQYTLGLTLMHSMFLLIFTLVHNEL
jgi:hypothetical protein